MDGFMRALVSVWTDSGFAALTIENVIMILVGLVLLYLAIAKEYEPLLLMPIAFGDIMANFPNTGFETDMGVMMAIGYGIKYEIFPPLIFMGVGAMTDFGPLIANPKTMLLGAAAQIGVFVALAGAMLLGNSALDLTDQLDYGWDNWSDVHFWVARAGVALQKNVELDAYYNFAAKASGSTEDPDDTWGIELNYAF